ncbi:MAG: PQQ-binding-like beta-propeller repeat protein [Planctomycetes bacterium]|nr:PQQ-binding-like beta-propeller repeat protein [Planctomycetota bacterium]
MRAFLLFAACAAAAAAQELSPRTDEALEARLARAARDAEEGRPAEAAARLAETLDDPETADVFAGEPRVGATLRGIRAAARGLAAELCRTAAGFRAEWEREARSRLLRLGPAPARAGLERVASRFRGTETAREARYRLAEEALEGGDVRRAAEMWERAGGGRTPAEFAREALARRRAGFAPAPREAAFRWSARGLAGLRVRLAGIPLPDPRSEILVRGKRVRLIDWLEGLGAAPVSPWYGERNGADPPFAAFRSIAGPPSLVSLTVPSNMTPGAGIRFVDPSAWSGSSTVRLLAQEGRAWAGVRTGVVALETDVRGTWEPLLEGKSQAPLAMAAACTDGRRVYALVRHPRAKEADDYRMLVAFEMRGGKPEAIWEANPGRDDGEAGFVERAWFSGPPVLVSGRLYVPAALVDSALIPAMGCFDAGTGEMLWGTPLAESARNLTAATNLPAASPPAVAGGLVFLCTNHGLVAALDAETGDPEWIHFYPRMWGLQAGWVDGPPRVAGGRVMFAPTDSPELIFLEARTGARAPSPPRGRGPEPRFRYALSDGRRFVLAGSLDGEGADGQARGAVKILNPAGGSDVLFELPDAPGGRPGLAEGRIWVPCAKAIYALDCGTGAVEVVHEWKEGEGPGDLVRLPGWLAVVRAGEIRFWKALDR